MKDKDEMTTAVTASSGGDEISQPKASVAAAAPGRYQAYKPGEGYNTRLGMMLVVLSYVGFACHHWYYNWVYLRSFAESMHLGFAVGWTYEAGVARFIAGGGTFLVAAVGFAIGYYYIYAKRESAEFLIKTDGELTKVTWPKISPWFRPDTQVWGATYVVLIVVALLTLYVFGVDMILNAIAKFLFYTSGS